MPKIESFIEQIESLKIPMWAFLIFLVSTASVRTYMEIVFFDYDDVSRLHFLHLVSYYIMVYLFVLLAIKTITNEKVDVISSVLTVSVPILLLPPIIDHYIFGRTIGYSYPSKYIWASMALSFFESNPSYIYRGHQVEFALILSLLAIYIYSKLPFERKVQRIALTLVSTFSIYVAIVALSTPTIWPLYNYLQITEPLTGFASDYPHIVYNFRYILLGFLSFLAAILLENPIKVKKLLRDSSPPRVLHFSLMFILGFFLQMSSLGGLQNVGEIYFRGNILILMLGIFSAASGWAFVVAINNYYDREEDRITNASRGLPRGSYTEVNILRFSLLALSAGAYTAAILGIIPLLFYLSFTGLGYLYSHPRIRLKKYGTKTVIIGLGSSLLFAMGYFSVWYPTEIKFDTRFWTYFFVIFAVFASGSVMNDLKDIESDARYGIKTIFTTFGRERGKRIASFLMLFAFSLPTIIAPSMAPIFIMLAILGSYLLLRERIIYIYLVYFAEYFIILFFHIL